MYRITKSRHQRRRRSLLWLLFAMLFLVIAALCGWLFLRSLHQEPVITQSKAVVTKVSYEGKTKHYTKPNFTIDIPVDWHEQPRANSTYQTYTWDTVEKNNNISLTIYEDTIPTNLAVNKALIVSGSGTHLELTGQASDNCTKYTTSNAPAVAGQFGVYAKWQNVDFICDRGTPTRDVIGTSSRDGINTVILTTSAGTQHKYFFNFTSNQLETDYTVFYHALATFGMR
ncbi:MAG: hypothetical protein ABIV43_01645 [Candidatus Saccharimonadales bacterium]